MFPRPRPHNSAIFTPSVHIFSMGSQKQSFENDDADAHVRFLIGSFPDSSHGKLLFERLQCPAELSVSWWDNVIEEVPLASHVKLLSFC